jgi:hypothetical protein
MVTVVLELQIPAVVAVVRHIRMLAVLAAPA